MEFMNMTDSIGIIMGQATTYTTGSMFLTLLIVVMALIAVAIMFGIKLEYTIILIMPLMLGYMAFYSAFVSVGLVMLFYIAFIMAKNFLFR